MALPIEDRVSNLEVRVNQLDGANLKDPTAAEIAKLKREIAGIKQTQRQLGLEVQRQLAEMNKTFSDLKVAVQAHLNQTP